jgi:hypothetical protein
MNDETTDLLERLIQVNKDMVETLYDIKSSLSIITNDLDIKKTGSYSRMHLIKLEEIESKLANIEINTSN